MRFTLFYCLYNPAGFGSLKAVILKRNGNRTLCVDLAFANVGVAIWDSVKREFVYTECFSTTKQKSEYASGDRIRRCQVLISRWSTIMELHPFKQILAEVPHGSQSAKGAIALGLCTGALIAFSELRKIPLFVSQPTWTRKFLGGVKGKQPAIDYVTQNYGEQYLPGTAGDEHVADAMILIAIALAHPEYNPKLSI